MKIEPIEVLLIILLSICLFFVLGSLYKVIIMPPDEGGEDGLNPF